MKLFSKLTRTMLIIGAAAYALSFLGYLIPVINTILFFAIIILVLNLTLKRLEYGVLAIFFELIIGSKGYLFSFSISDNFVLSIRMAMFLIIMIVWLIQALKNKRLAIAESKFFAPLVTIAALIVIGGINGYLSGNPNGANFFDLNGYLYFALALPVFEIARNKFFIKKLLTIFLGGTIILSALSLFLFGDFFFTKQWARPNLSEAISIESASAKEAASGKFAYIGIKNRLYDESGKPVEYRWQKDLGLGTISYVSGRFFRVFSSGQIYALFGFLFAMFLILKRWKRDRTTLYLGITAILTLLTLGISFSRSLWTGAAGGIIFMLFLLPKKRAILIALTIIVLLIAAVMGSYFFAPKVYQTISNRIISIAKPEQELAGQNRLNLLEPINMKIKNRPILGQGFGTPIVYESVVPEKQGFIKVYVYEWGYHDLIIKMGILGLLVYAWIFFEIFRETYKANKVLGMELKSKGKETKQCNPMRCAVTCALSAGIIGMLITNATSPYLNHPLGIGFILMAMAVIYAIKKALVKKVALRREKESA